MLPLVNVLGQSSVFCRGDGGYDGIQGKDNEDKLEEV
jgi:hypothetical protein